jgi:predicted GH43/DUF377 family glycosyl hydrolase
VNTVTHKIRTVDAQVTRLGVALHPDGEHEHEGVLNPASALDQKGRLLLFTRSVAKGNVSRVGIVRMAETSDGALTAERLGFALEPEADYERQGNGGRQQRQEQRPDRLRIHPVQAPRKR